MTESENQEQTDEVLPEVEASGKYRGTVEVQRRAFEPAPLALLSEDDFNRRLQLGQLEIERMKKIQRSIMTVDVDYGTIPGTDKPTLYQPGAQILNRMAGFRPDYQPERITGDGVTAPNLTYQVRCQLLDRDGFLVSEGRGSANSWEKKHRYRYADRVCPECGVEAIISSQYEGQKYYCFPKKGGCKATFAPGTQSEGIDAQPKMMENPDPHELDNTLLKMACKRSYIAATVQAHACSGQFAQDTDELPPEDEQDAAQQHEGGPKTARQAPSRSRNGNSRPSRSQDDSPLSEGRVKLCWGRLCGRMREIGHEVTEQSKHEAREVLLEPFGVQHFSELKTSQLEDLLEAIAAFE